MRPLAMSASALARLVFDHGLRGVRGVNRCNQAVSSSACFWLSIHPHASAASRAALYVREAPFPLVMRRKTPADRAWLARSHATHFARLGSARTGSDLRVTGPSSLLSRIC